MSAAFSSQAVVNLVNKNSSFSSENIKNLYHYASGFTFSLHIPGDSENINDDLRRLGSVLMKFAHRGTPAPCSIKLEEFLLEEARKEDILDYFVDKYSGEISFTCESIISAKELNNSLKISQIPELLISDEEAEKLFQEYLDLCTEPERYFFNILSKSLLSKNIPLIFLPQRHFDKMGVEGHEEERVDFACEIPYLDSDKWLKIVVEIDDATHSGAIIKKDRARDRDLEREGWKVFRFPTSRRGSWKLNCREITTLINHAIPEPYFEAAEKIRSMDISKRRALDNLTALPMAESKILMAVGHMIYDGKSGEISVMDVQNIGLEPVISSVQEIIDNFRVIHSIDKDIKITLCKNNAIIPDIKYYRYPSVDIWSEINKKDSVVISPATISSDYIQPNLRASIVPLKSRCADNEDFDKSLLFFLNNIFRKKDFRPKQIEIIKRALKLKPVVALLPTAAGKSLCYQMTGILQPGVVVIIDPLRSLMIDQVNSLEFMGLHRCMPFMSGAGNIDTSDREIREKGYENFEKGFYDFIFSAPERLQMPDFIHLINRNMSNISYCVVDEAHCVSEWGHDFRPAYMNVWRRMGEGSDFKPVFMALTGTASQNVLFDIKHILKISDIDSVIRPESFERKELEYYIHETSPDKRIDTIKDIFKECISECGVHNSHPCGLVFTSFTNGELGVRALSEPLKELTQEKINVFSGGCPKWSDKNTWDKCKFELQKKFKEKKENIIVCTHSFGMGIDRPDIRFTIHSLLPRSIEDFYQQAGRAGRDGNKSKCHIIFVDNIPGLADKLMDIEHYSYDDIKKAYRNINSSDSSNSDIIRNLWFWSNNFPGKTFEMHFAEEFLLKEIVKIIDVNSNFSKVIKIPYLNRQDYEEYFKIYGITLDVESQIEKVLYRYFISGIIEDYEKDYTAKNFKVTLGYAKPEEMYDKLKQHFLDHISEKEMDFYFPKAKKTDWYNAALDCVNAHVEYYYDIIEKRRRRSIGNMLKVVRTGLEEGTDKFSSEILNYLEKSKYTEPVEKIARYFDTATAIDILISIRDVQIQNDDLYLLLWACRKELEEFPNNSYLLIIAGICQTITGDAKGGKIEISNGLATLDNFEKDKMISDRILEILNEIPAIALCLNSTEEKEQSNLIKLESGTESPENREIISGINNYKYSNDMMNSQKLLQTYPDGENVITDNIINASNENLFENCDDLKSIEKLLLEEIKEVKLIGQIPFTDNDYDKLCDLISNNLSNKDHNTFKENILKYRASVCFYLVWNGIYNYDDGKYWEPVFSDIYGFSIQKETDLGELFLRFINDNDLLTVNLNYSKKYLTQILFHGLIPEKMIGEYYDKIISDLYYNELINPLDKNEIAHWLEENRIIQKSLDDLDEFKGLKKETKSCLKGLIPEDKIEDINFRLKEIENQIEIKSDVIKSLRDVEEYNNITSGFFREKEFNEYAWKYQIRKKIEELNSSKQSIESELNVYADTEHDKIRSDYYNSVLQEINNYISSNPEKYNKYFKNLCLKLEEDDFREKYDIPSDFIESLNKIYDKFYSGSEPLPTNKINYSKEEFTDVSDPIEKEEINSEIIDLPVYEFEEGFELPDNEFLDFTLNHIYAFDNIMGINNNDLISCDDKDEFEKYSFIKSNISDNYSTEDLDDVKLIQEDNQIIEVNGDSKLQSEEIREEIDAGGKNTVQAKFSVIDELSPNNSIIEDNELLNNYIDVSLENSGIYNSDTANPLATEDIVSEINDSVILGNEEEMSYGMSSAESENKINPEKQANDIFADIIPDLPINVTPTTDNSKQIVNFDKAISETRNLSSVNIHANKKTEANTISEESVNDILADKSSESLDIVPTTGNSKQIDNFDKAISEIKNLSSVNTNINDHNLRSDKTSIENNKLSVFPKDELALNTNDDYKCKSPDLNSENVNIDKTNTKSNELLSKYSKDYKLKDKIQNNHPEKPIISKIIPDVPEKSEITGKNPEIEIKESFEVKSKRRIILGNNINEERIENNSVNYSGIKDKNSVNPQNNKKTEKISIFAKIKRILFRK
ncbi:RecQ family ATP-dependent DNA helicase [Methanoplanus endosymbiosus]|uniref:RecQ family ATP-dependent DNA helicase n=1 Tax=Methanoplanus endosymbiosus TaxID=33865 RepID=A0A9E7PLZ1_9EURY|nr:RecQ family ATP-dependent DNA helicase [Methanoplanus endosymbiosus]UUX92633.1 RecQ family ATP-dependent DNA helicase [Methanoplanus endosymbiosus]